MLARPHAEFALFGIDGVLIVVSAAVAVAGVLAAWRLFGVEWWIFRRAPDPERVAALAGANSLTRFLYRASLNKWWLDDLNHLLFIVVGGG
ncbi:MAG: hypothetical protein C4317_10140, partial [Acidimicrobiia bacterium]